jgi:hypothetical protein
VLVLQLPLVRLAQDPQVVALGPTLQQLPLAGPQLGGK